MRRLFAAFFLFFFLSFFFPPCVPCLLFSCSFISSLAYIHRFLFVSTYSCSFDMDAWITVLVLACGFAC
ncbi:hypothetical protein BCR44DRAFT_1429689 [Catenaria anguillulae PL171]|uniref:Secreted peptide n=1 Tax=Catenaria anguillulae PL171 TaxID=765915 RepID=A0A1Y2HSV1_9FUNG|nr:hypothetical protein BCR44DRAFT_1429689 [Catenaria anguillulae PL171]